MVVRTYPGHCAFPQNEHRAWVRAGDSSVQSNTPTYYEAKVLRVFWVFPFRLVPTSDQLSKPRFLPALRP